MADWSRLPCDILGSIVLNFEDIVDCVYFCAVCHSFKRAYNTVKETSQMNIMPWLFLPENTKENPECLRKLFSLGANKCYQLSLPETFGRRCWGSSYGWIVTLGLDHEMHLFNPLTKARKCLPHPSTLPTYAAYELDSERLRWAFVTKAVVLRVRDGFVVMVVYGECRSVAFARLEDQVWTPLQGANCDSIILVDDFCNLDGRIIVLFNGRLGYCDINSSSPYVRDLLPAPCGVLGTKVKTPTLNKLYLVNSKRNLFVLWRFKEHISVNDDDDFDDEEVNDDDDDDDDEEDDDDDSDEDEGEDDDDSDEEEINETYNTVEFAVFRLYFHTRKWTEIHDLGDVALFVGDGHSKSLNILNSGNCVGNRIYFTDDECQFWKLPRELGGHDMGAFSVGDKDMSITPYYEDGDLHSSFCTSFWFTPMI